MNISTQYTDIIAQARAQGKTVVHFDQIDYKVDATASKGDSFTLSGRAKAKMQGENFQAEAPTYVRPKVPSSALTPEQTEDTPNTQETRFAEMLQSILNKRLGIDTEKLEEIEEQIELIKADDKLSDEEKIEKIKALEKAKQQLIDEGAENHLNMSKEQKESTFTE